MDVLKQIANKDSRIKIKSFLFVFFLIIFEIVKFNKALSFNFNINYRINNKKMVFLLYSRGKGILNSKGEYLMFKKPDYLLKDSNDLKFLYNKKKIFNVDIVSFYILYLFTRKN